MDEIYLHSLESASLADIVKEEYRNYQIYTLMDRAIPYLRDGLKPSQRRILFTLWKNQSKGLMKVSSTTGLVLTLHPHGPQSVESTIVNLAQDFTFSNNYPLIDKKGYFGERMETAPAASRYIECKVGKVAELLLFDDMNQVDMIPNYDEKVMEPAYFLPKLPLMLLNGAEGIGTGFSSVVPCYNHKDIIDSMVNCIDVGKPKKITPWVRSYNEKIEVDDNNRIIFKMAFVQEKDTIYISELPRGYDAKKIYRHLSKFIDKDYIKDFIDHTVDNNIRIELVFKRGQTPTIEEVEREMGVATSISPNFTLISERGVKIFEKAEQIIAIFTQQRLDVVKRRYELLVEDYTRKILQNSEIIRFIKEKHYAQAVKVANRKAFVDYLVNKKFTYSDYLADMAIYRMTKDEVGKRELMVKDDKKALKECERIAESPRLIKGKLKEELADTREQLSKIMDEKEKQKKKVYARSEKKSKKRK